MSILLSSCMRVETDYGFNQDVSKAFFEKLENGIFVERVQLKNNIIEIVFSDGYPVRIASTNSPIVQIGLDGYWYLNGICSYKKLSSFDAFDIVQDSIINDSCLSQTATVCCILEDYKYWTFCFTDGSSINILKSVFSYDYDSIIRGINHRGFSASTPENTLTAFLLSRLEGFTYVETDIRFTSDNVPVCIHDVSVNRTSNGHGLVSEFTLSQLKEMDFGSWKDARFKDTKIPTLEEFLSLCSQVGLKPYIELKAGNHQQVGVIISLVEKYGLRNDVVYISVSSGLLMSVLAYDSNAHVGLVTSRITPNTIKIIEGLRQKVNKVSQVFIDSSDYSLEAVYLCQANNVSLEVWTIDSPTAVLDLPRYVSGVTSNVLHAGQVLRIAK